MATTEVEKRTYSVSQAAKVLTIRYENLKILLDRGYIGYLNFGEKRIPKPEIERFMKENMGVDFKKIFKEEKEKSNETQIFQRT